MGYYRCLKYSINVHPAAWFWLYHKWQACNIRNVAPIPLSFQSRKMVFEEKEDDEMKKSRKNLEKIH